jgi:hypothetical protein
MACTGHVTIAERDPSGGPQQVPVQCTGDDGVPLPASEFVIGITRVYAYTTQTNANPVIDKMTQDGNDIDAGAGINVAVCTANKTSNCPDIHIDTHVPDTSWELDPADVENGSPLREQIWVDYYTDQGEFNDDARLLFDTRKGRPDDSSNKYHAPKVAGDGTVWAVVHDNRGGTAWMVVPIHVK